MPPFRIPIDRPHPDSTRFMRVVLGKEKVEKPPLSDYMVDDPVRKFIVTQLLNREWVGNDPYDRTAQAAYWDNSIEFFYRMGYDYLMMEIPLPFKKQEIAWADTATLTSGSRLWADEHQGLISSWDDFERYDWPRVEDADFFPFEYVNSHLRDGMGLIASHSGGIFEYVSWIMSLEGLAYAIHDNPELVTTVCEKIGSLQEQFFDHLLELDHLIAIWPGDDMGFRTSTLVSPIFLRKYILPWHKKITANGHAKGIPCFFHSCGNIESIMEDLIEDVQIDAKHSTEDTIQPGSEFQQRYGNRIGFLGGVDMNVLASSQPDPLRAYVRKLIDDCAPKGRFAIGAGNSVANYIPVENYLTMIDEALS